MKTFSVLSVSSTLIVYSVNSMMIDSTLDFNNNFVPNKTRNNFRVHTQTSVNVSQLFFCSKIQIMLFLTAPKYEAWKLQRLANKRDRRSSFHSDLIALSLFSHIYDDRCLLLMFRMFSFPYFHLSSQPDTSLLQFICTVWIEMH